MQRKPLPNPPEPPQKPHLTSPALTNVLGSGWSVPMKYKTTPMVAQVTDFI